jgi:phospholipase C
MLISPYALHGKIDSTPLEHSSILKFIEYNWSLDPLAQRDANASNILTAFDFQQSPRPGEFLPMERATRAVTSSPEPRRAWIFVLYGGALVIAIIVFTALLGVMVTSRIWKPVDPKTVLKTPQT